MEYSTSFFAPKAASSSVISTWTWRSRPARTRDCGVEAPPKALENPPPNIDENASAKADPKSAPSPPPPRRASGPPMSYILRLSGSESVS